MEPRLLKSEYSDDFQHRREVAGSVSMVVESDPDLLRDYAGQLEELAEDAVEPNAFYEPWMLFPALDYYAGRSQFVFLLVYIRVLKNGQEYPLMCGFFPMEYRGWYRRLPLRNLTLWHYPHCYLSTPLLRKGFVDETLQFLISWFRRQHDYKLLELSQITAHGLLHDGLRDRLSREPDLRYTDGAYERALFRPRKDADVYLNETLSRVSRKQYRRLQRRLSEEGKLTWDELKPEDALDPWIDDFLRLEASGWKGRSGTALMLREEDRQFFNIIAEMAFCRQRLMVLALRLNNRTVAIIFSLLADDGGYAFKMAYDENYRRFSPGVLLMIELTRRLHARPGLRWLDSCADPQNHFANRLWKDRKPMSNLIISNGHMIGNGIVRALPRLKKLKNRLSDR